MNWPEDDPTRPGGGDAPTAPRDDDAGSATPHDGPAADPAGDLPGRAGGFPDVSVAAFVAGIAALVAGPVLAGDGTAQYVVLAASVVAVALGAVGLWTSRERPGRLDFALAGLATGGVSLYLSIRNVADPPQGGT